MVTISIDSLTDRELLERTFLAARDERHLTANLLALLAECDKRQLYLGEGCSSLFTYCTQVLHLSEHAAYHRIEAARAARRFPVILELIGDGSVTLTTVALLRAHLTRDNHEVLLAAARYCTKREVEHQIACLAPKPDAKTVIRRLPAPAAAPTKATDIAGACLAPAVDTASSDELHVAPRRCEDSPAVSAAPAPAEPRPRVEALSADRYLLRVTLGAETVAQLRRAQALMSHNVTNGDPAVIIDKALSLLVEHLERRKPARVQRPRVRATRTSASSNGSRHIPAAIRRQVWTRDDGRCAFVGARGRCAESSRLELHHIIPFCARRPDER
jgi:hypothetical protein